MVDEKPGPSADDLRKRAERAQHSLNSARKAKSEEKPGTVKAAGVMFNELLAGVRAMFNLPILRFGRPIIGFLGPKYAWAYAKFATNKQGRSSLSRRAGTLATLTIGSFVPAYFLLTSVIPNTLRFTYDALVINIFAYEDVLVFGKPDWVVGEPGVLSVFACRRYPCEGQSDSIEFRMRDSFYLDVVRTVTRLEPHDPGELAGAFLSEENACKFKAYGKRIKYLGFYPDLIEATCRPINGENASNALSEMQKTIKGK